MPTYTMLANVDDAEFQNPQELATLWGDIENDLAEAGVDLEETYTVLGGYDFQLTFEVEDDETAFEAAFLVQRYGFEVQTMKALSIERIGEVIEDV